MIAVAQAHLSDPRLVALIDESNAYAVANSPPGLSYAVSPAAADAAGARYWLALEGEAAIGCIGLMALEAGHGEIKSMHVGAAHRGKGAARALLSALIEAAKAAGMARISLETGSSEGYAASRALYARMGFEPCPPFGAYLDDGVSYCMTRAI